MLTHVKFLYNRTQDDITRLKKIVANNPNECLYDSFSRKGAVSNSFNDPEIIQTLLDIKKKHGLKPDVRFIVVPERTKTLDGIPTVVFHFLAYTDKYQLNGEKFNKSHKVNLGVFTALSDGYIHVVNFDGVIHHQAECEIIESSSITTKRYINTNPTPDAVLFGWKELDPNVPVLSQIRAMGIYQLSNHPKVYYGIEKKSNGISILTVITGAHPNVDLSVYLD